MIDIDTAIEQLEISVHPEWYSAKELNLLLIAAAPKDDIYWWTTPTIQWEKVESVAQIPDILNLVQEYGHSFSFEDEEPITKYAQGSKMDDGNFVLELAVVNGQSYNMRIGYGPTADTLSSEPDADVQRSGPQSLKLAQVSEVLTNWLQGRGLPDGYGGSIHVYG